MIHSVLKRDPSGAVPCLVVLLLLGVQSGAGAQGRRIGADAPPDSVAAGFQAALRAGAWAPAAALMHPDALESFRRVLRIVTQADTTGAAREALLPGAASDDVTNLPSQELFVRAARNLGTRMPGILHSLSAREITVLGTVTEPPDRAHAVYRNTDLLEGAVPQIRVMTLRRHKRRWRVVDSEELQLIREAIRGLARIRPPPPGGNPRDGA